MPDNNNNDLKIECIRCAKSIVLFYIAGVDGLDDIEKITEKIVKTAKNLYSFNGDKE